MPRFRKRLFLQKLPSLGQYLNRAFIHGPTNHIIMSYHCCPGGDGLFEHVGGGAGRAEAREAHRQPHTGDPVQEGSPTGHCRFLQMSVVAHILV